MATFNKQTREDIMYIVLSSIKEGHLNELLSKGELKWLAREIRNKLKNYNNGLQNYKQEKQ